MTMPSGTNVVPAAPGTEATESPPCVDVERSTPDNAASGQKPMATFDQRDDLLDRTDRPCVSIEPIIFPSDNNVETAPSVEEAESFLVHLFLYDGEDDDATPVELLGEFATFSEAKTYAQSEANSRKLPVALWLL